MVNLSDLKPSNSFSGIVCLGWGYPVTSSFPNVHTWFLLFFALFHREYLSLVVLPVIFDRYFYTKHASLLVRLVFGLSFRKTLCP